MQVALSALFSKMKQFGFVVAIDALLHWSKACAVLIINAYVAIFYSIQGSGPRLQVVPLRPRLSVRSC